MNTSNATQHLFLFFSEFVFTKTKKIVYFCFIILKQGITAQQKKLFPSNFLKEIGTGSVLYFIVIHSREEIDFLHHLVNRYLWFPANLFFLESILIVKNK